MKSCNKVNFAIEISKTFFRPNSYTFRFVCIPLYTWHERQIYISKSVKVLPFDTPHWGTRTSGSSLPKLRHWEIISFFIISLTHQSMTSGSGRPKLRHWEITFFYYFFDSSIDRPLTKWTISPTKQPKCRYFETSRKNKLVNHVLWEYID